jgi:hypothetical protein
MNQITSFPMAIAMQPNLRLKYLNLSENPSIIFPPLPVAQDPSGTKVLEYFTDLRAKGGVLLDPISVLLVGRGGSGKSTLVYRAVKGHKALPNGSFFVIACPCTTHSNCCLISRHHKILARSCVLLGSLSRVTHHGG